MSHDWIGFTAVLCLFGGPMIVAAVWLIARAWLQAVVHEREIELKHRLLDAGMTASEIERVLNAGQARAAADDGLAAAPASETFA